jgi:hypothetical protein
MFKIPGKSDNVLKKCSCAARHSSKLESTDRRCSFCSTVNSRLTNLTYTRLASKPLVKTAVHEPREISISLASSLIKNRRHVTKSRASATTFRSMKGVRNACRFLRTCAQCLKWRNHSKNFSAVHGLLSTGSFNPFTSLYQFYRVLREVWQYTRFPYPRISRMWRTTHFFFPDEYISSWWLMACKKMFRHAKQSPVAGRHMVLEKLTQSGWLLIRPRTIRLTQY